MVVDPLKAYPGYQLRRASGAQMAVLARRLAVLELRPTEATVLRLIDVNPGIKQSAIGRLLEIASANMAPLTARLYERGLIVREPVDGRSHGLKLSESGRRLAAKVSKVVSDHEERLMAKIPRPLRSAFLAALRALWADDSSAADEPLSSAVDRRPRRGH